MSLKEEVGKLSDDAVRELSALQRRVEVQAHAIDLMAETTLEKALPYLIAAGSLVVGGFIGAWWF